MSASVEHGGTAFEKPGAAPPVVIAMPDDESHVGADNKFKKDARLTKYAKSMNYFRIAKYLFFLLAMIGIIVLALQVSKDQDTIQQLNHEMVTAPHVQNAVFEDHIGGRMSYLEGFSGMTADDDDTVALVGRDVMASDGPSTATSTVVTSISSVASTVGEDSATETCSSTTSDSDTTVNVIKTTTTFLSVVSSTTAAGESTTTTDTTQVTLHTQMTTTIFSNTSGIPVFSAASASSLPTGTSLFSVDPLSASLESSTMASVTAVSASTTPAPATAPTTPGLVPNNPSHCLEFGDGAGPCNRPYGAPNTPPSSIVLSVDSRTTSYPPPSLEPIPFTSPSIPGVISSTTVDTGALSGTLTTASSTTSDSSISAMSVTETAASSAISDVSVSAMSVTETAASSAISDVSVSATSVTETATSSIVSDVDTSVCGPPTTIYVTVTSSADSLSVEGGVTIASFDTGSDSSTSPSTVTSTSTSRATTITVSLASATETVSNSTTTTTTTSSSSHLITATGFTLTLTAHSNGTYSPTTTGPSTIATIPATGGGEKAGGGKPMGASGNGGTGNGMYCVVMLVTLLALLI